MATTVTADTYLELINTARTQLQTCFRRTHELLTEREAHLLRELETIQSEHEAETRRQQEELQGLEKSKQSLKKNLRNEDTLNIALAAINDKILKLSLGTIRSIRFQWKIGFDADIQNAGKIIAKSIPLPVIPDTVSSQYLIPESVILQPVITESVIPQQNIHDSGIPQSVTLESVITPQTVIRQSVNLDSANIPQTVLQPAIPQYVNNANQLVFPQCATPLLPAIPQYSAATPLLPAIPQYATATPLLPDISQYATNVNQPVTLLMPAILGYQNRSLPVITCCKHNKSNTPGEIYKPYGLAIEPLAGKIYLVDYNRVQVFSSDGEYYYMFNSNMNWPWGICVSNDFVYVSQWCGHCINLYTLGGTHINTLGSQGRCEGQFSRPQGIAVCNNASKYLYVCDRNNNRVQIFTRNLLYYAMLGKDIIKFPNDVNITEEFVIVLDQSDPCIHIFSFTNNSLLRSLIHLGKDIFHPNKQIGESLFFTIDKKSNIILTDNNMHCVMIFTLAGEIIAKFGKKGQASGEFNEPTGVGIDKQNRIIVVSQSKNAALQFF